MKSIIKSEEKVVEGVEYSDMVQDILYRISAGWNMGSIVFKDEEKDLVCLYSEDKRQLGIWPKDYNTYDGQRFVKFSGKIELYN